MVKFNDFFIEIDKPLSVFAPGETVTGHLHIDVSEVLLCDSVVVQFHGSARVFWVERELTPTAPKGAKPDANRDCVDLRNVPYSSEKVFFDTRVTLWSQPNPVNRSSTLDEILKKNSCSGLRISNAKLSGQDISKRPSLQPGKHKFPFEFELPTELPTSFDASHSYCSIRYFVKAHICEWNLTKHGRKQYFTVVRPFDLNFMAGLNETKQQQGRRTDAASCRSGEKCMSAVLRVHKSGYVPGQPLVVSADVENNWSQSIKCIQVQLIQHVTCTALMSDSHRAGHKTSKRVIATVAREDKLRKDEKTQYSPCLYIPSLTPTFKAHDMIDVSYSVALKVAFNRRDREAALFIELPIVIGTVPLEMQPQGKIQAPPSYESAMNRAPPSYQESVTGVKDDYDPFLPLYPVYTEE